MTPKEFTEKELKRYKALFVGTNNLSPEEWYTIMDNYHKAKLKLLNLHGVSNNEVSVCEHEFVDLENTTTPAAKCKKCGLIVD